MKLFVTGYKMGYYYFLQSPRVWSQLRTSMKRFDELHLYTLYTFFFVFSSREIVIVLYGSRKRKGFLCSCRQRKKKAILFEWKGWARVEKSSLSSSLCSHLLVLSSPICLFELPSPPNQRLGIHKVRLRTMRGKTLVWISSFFFLLFIFQSLQYWEFVN